MVAILKTRTEIIQLLNSHQPVWSKIKDNSLWNPGAGYNGYAEHFLPLLQRIKQLGLSSGLGPVPTLEKYLGVDNKDDITIERFPELAAAKVVLAGLVNDYFDISTPLYYMILNTINFEDCMFPDLHK